MFAKEDEVNCDISWNFKLSLANSRRMVEGECGTFLVVCSGWKVLLAVVERSTEFFFSIVDVVEAWSWETFSQDPEMVL